MRTRRAGPDHEVRAGLVHEAPFDGGGAERLEDALRNLPNQPGGAAQAPAQ